MECWNPDFLKFIADLGKLRENYRATEFSTWANKSVGFRDDFSNQGCKEYSNKFFDLTQKVADLVVSGKVSPLENELTNSIIFRFRKKVEKKTTSYVIIETMYMVTLRVLFEKKRTVNKEVLQDLRSLFEQLSLYRNLRKQEFVILNSIIQFLIKNRLYSALVKEMSQYKNTVTLYEKRGDKAFELINLSRSEIEEELRLTLNYLKEDKRGLDRVNCSEFFQKRINEYNFTHVQKIELHIIPKEFEFLIPDCAYFSGSFFNREKDIFLINSGFAKSDVIVEQLELLFVHEIFPGHAQHINRAYQGNFGSILPFVMSKESLEGWALYQEFLFSEENPQCRFYYHLQMARRYLTTLYTLNTKSGLSEFENERFFDHIFEEMEVTSDYHSFLQKARKNSQVTARYISGFNQIMAMSGEERDFLKRFGPIDLDLTGNLIRKKLL